MPKELGISSKVVTPNERADQAERAKFDALKGQNPSAQGKRSAALGRESQMNPLSFFQSGWRIAPTGLEKREVGVCFTSTFHQILIFP